MLQILSKLFIRDRENLSDAGVRRAWGVLCSGLGIALNVVLFAVKLLAGMLSGSIAIVADAFNNLSDAGSSVITLIGFRLAAKKPDRDHPFGHGRLEYIAGLMVALVILLMAFELGKSSFGKILHPEAIEASALTVGILVFSILVKLYMFLYNRAVGARLGSSAMRATARDSLSDCVSTFAVLVCTLLARFTGAMLDGWAGMVVALFILYNGIGAVKETISPLLGEPPAPEFVEEVKRLVLGYADIVGIHDLIVHDYGPGRRMISLHAEVPAAGDMLEIHDVIDNAEREIGEKLGCEVLIHMDPIATDDADVAALRTEVAALATALGEGVTIHDFRIVRGPSHTNLIFDLVLPADNPRSPAEARRELETLIRERFEEDYRAVVTVDRAYV
jgi:cation diffusion facilitator family transporter